MKISFVLAIILLSGLSIGKAQCQNADIFNDLESNRPGNGKIKIVQDTTIKNVFDRFLWEQSKIGGIDGFRIRIFSDSGPDAKNKFEDTKARFISSYEDIKVHESFVYPNYKIYVGDFRTKSEAMKVLNIIERRFPDAFIVQTKINFPKIKAE